MYSINNSIAPGSAAVNAPDHGSSRKRRSAASMAASLSGGTSLSSGTVPNRLLVRSPWLRLTWAICQSSTDRPYSRDIHFLISGIFALYLYRMPPSGDGS